MHRRVRRLGYSIHHLGFVELRVKWLPALLLTAYQVSSLHCMPDRLLCSYARCLCCAAECGAAEGGWRQGWPRQGWQGG